MDDGIVSDLASAMAGRVRAAPGPPERVPRPPEAQPGPSAALPFLTAELPDLPVAATARAASRARFRIRWPVVGAVVAYAALALVVYWPMWPGDGARIAQCPCADAGLNAWFLAWTPYAIVHGHNPFFTTWLNVPKGMNLAVNAQMPLLGLLAAPLTVTAGPLASLSLLMWLAFPVSATSMFLVLSRWTSRAWAAFAGGLLYGFSPYMAGQSTAHLHLIFLPFPPLIVLSSFEIFVARGGSARRWGIVLGVCVSAQLLISTEILAMTAVVVAVGLLVLCMCCPGRVIESLRFALHGLGWTVGIVGLAVSYPMWMMLAGPLHGAPPTAAQLTSTPFRADLLGPVVPTSAMRLAPGSWERVGDHLIALGDYSEDGSYLGIPLLLLLAYLSARSWRNRWVRFSLLMAMVCFVLSLGPSLHVDARNTGVPLPFALLQRVPLVKQVLPARISMLTDLCLAIVLALTLDDWFARISRLGSASGAARGSAVNSPSSMNPRQGFRVRLEIVGTSLLGVCALLSLLPRWPDPTVPSAIPSYFTSEATSRIPAGSVVLTYPYPMPSYAQPMVWQSTSSMEFRLLGGYGLTPGRGGVSTLFPIQLEPFEVQQFLVEQAGGVVFYEAPRVTAGAGLMRAIRVFVRRYEVGSVLVDQSERDAKVVDEVLESALGVRPVDRGGISAWYAVQRLADVRAVVLDSRHEVR